MSALVIGNRKTKTVEIIFGASQDPSNIFRKDEPRKLKNFKGSEKLKRYIERGENAKYATMDWAGNNLKSPVVTPPNQKAALKFAEEIQGKYKNGYNGYITLTDTNGHSEGGGESVYTASGLNLRCFTIDSTPVINPGRYINNNEFLTIVPNMGNGTLTATEKVKGTAFHIAKFKIGTSGKREYKFLNTLAIPVEYDREREQRIKEIFKDNKTALIFLDSFKQHCPDNELDIERIEELQRYAEKIAPEFYEKYKAGGYIDRKEPENVFVR
ncbi:hypothetical protein EII29_04280 [Leptotrichia sp. OH3620_COT-345]|uniref:hypothetical protein n=1 Tax=Leptotrichia sp. OH3620_COT-345 TaxID=2491048 RepID=UPI000F655AB2|nr:hypothetical protein [Leptotrichia sp. OH3620_COT-345]RRD40032.1 hypothetical protein EII29_04280 [Leptotrichia sp. OH3620_COT-345]